MQLVIFTFYPFCLIIDNIVYWIGAIEDISDNFKITKDVCEIRINLGKFQVGYKAISVGLNGFRLTVILEKLKI